MASHEFTGSPEACSWCDEPPRRAPLIHADGGYWHPSCREKYQKVWHGAAKPPKSEPRKKAPTRMAALILGAVLQSACAGPDPYSWDDIVCAHKLPSDANAAYQEAVYRIRHLGGSIEFRPASDGLAGTAKTHATRPCTVLLFEGWDRTPFLMAAVPWHEHVHCIQAWGGDRYARELPAFRQEIQVGRAIGTPEADLHDRAATLLEHWDWLTAENMDLVLEHCPGAATPRRRR